MTYYELTKDAENDLREVARYTHSQWGKEKFQEYRGGLKRTFKAIGQHKVLQHSFSNEFPELFVTKYKYHFIFYLRDNFEKPVIVGVIHEKRDMLNRLTERLSL